MRIHPRSLLIPLCLGSLASATAAQAQTTFSVDHVSASDGDPDCTGALTVEAGDVLRANLLGGKPALAAPDPVCVSIPAGLGAGTLGLGLPFVADIDALSYGNDARVGMNVPTGSVWFSVTRSSRGLPLPLPFEPNVRTEWGCGDQGASVFVDTGLPTLPANWAASSGRHVEAIDGNGYASCTGYSAPGLGLIEPQSTGGAIDADDLDALDVDQPGGRVYFSLDGTLTDLCEGVTGADSAASHGFNPADVLVSDLSGAAPTLWAPALALGLDRAGAGTDDLDALAIWDNGNGFYNSLELPFEWLGGTADMVLFSVRNGSAVIGAMDSISGSPIEAGDILMPPFPGGVTPNPGILIPAEALGLATIRSAHGYVCMGAMVSDDLDGLDTTDFVQFDCNGNGTEDALDIVFGTSSDADKNGVPDECQPPRKILRSNAPSGSSERRVNLR